MECPDENTLAMLAEPAFPDHPASEERAIAARHLDTCSSCRETVSSLLRGAETSSLALAPTMALAAEAEEARECRPGDLVAQRYRLERIVGEGGLGVVWAASDVTSGRPVALKVLKFRVPEIDRRFLREARVANVVRHPNIVEVHDVVEVPDGSLAMVMDLLGGDPLDRVMQQHGPLTLGTTLRILLPVLEALAAAHAFGIVHRDLKPQNIFLSRNADGSARPVLLDFGLAKLTATDGALVQTSVLTREHQLLGTPLYMAPEQLYGELDIDVRTDVWAVGVVLFECLTGKLPLDGRTVGQLMRSLATREIPKIASLAPALPPAFASMIDTMLTRDRAARPATIAPVVVAAAELVASGIA